MGLVLGLVMVLGALRALALRCVVCWCAACVVRAGPWILSASAMLMVHRPGGPCCSKELIAETPHWVAHQPLPRIRLMSLDLGCQQEDENPKLKGPTLEHLEISTKAGLKARLLDGGKSAGVVAVCCLLFLLLLPPQRTCAAEDERALRRCSRQYPLAFAPGSAEPPNPTMNPDLDCV